MPNRRSEAGQTTVLFAVVAVAVLSTLALSLDAGRAYIRTHQLKTAADAAVLAGAQELPGDPTLALADAAAAAAANGVPGGDLRLSLSQGDTMIQATAEGGIRYLFAPLFGVQAGNLAATSAAVVGPITQIQGAVPLGVYRQDFVYGQSYTLKAGAGNGSCGDYGALSFPGPDGEEDDGAEAYRQDLAQGYSGTLTVGEAVQTKPGDMVGPTDAALGEREQEDPGATAGTAVPDSPRILYLPIISPSDCGRSQVDILGFAAFFLQSVQRGAVTGVFLHTVIDGVPGQGAGDYGLEAERLVQ